MYLTFSRSLTKMPNHPGMWL